MDSFKYVRLKIARISRTFVRDPNILRRDQKIAETVKAAKLYKICYCLDFAELRADYNDHVYDNGGRPRRRKWY